MLHSPTARDSAGTPRDPVLAHDAAIVEAATKLRPLSHSTAALVELASSEAAELGAFGKVIANDQVLAATVLREANSASSAGREQIGSVDQALVRLGLSRVLTIAIRSSVSDQLDVAIPEYGLAPGQLALDSVVGSIAAEVVRERSRTPLPAELPTAALLRDIGLLVLAHFLDAPHLTLLDITREAGASLAAGERMVLDANHAEVGAVLCQAWRFSDTVRLGVQYHHDPDACEEPVAYGLFVADAIAHRISSRSAHPWSHSQPDESTLTTAMEAIGLPVDAFDHLVDETLTRFAARDSGLHLELAA
jgi:HD-like signal output (HDOD) protein